VFLSFNRAAPRSRKFRIPDPSGRGPGGASASIDSRGGAPYSPAAVLILGLNAWHADAAAVLLRDGVPVLAAEESRFTRVKHTAGFPEFAVRACLEAAGP
jgi:hypothetical protein